MRNVTQDVMAPPTPLLIGGHAGYVVLLICAYTNANCDRGACKEKGRGIATRRGPTEIGDCTLDGLRPRGPERRRREAWGELAAENVVVLWTQTSRTKPTVLKGRRIPRYCKLSGLRNSLATLRGVTSNQKHPLRHQPSQRLYP